MIILLFGGLLADAMNRRKLMMVTQGSLFFVSGALALLSSTGQVTPEKLYAVTALLAAQGLAVSLRHDLGGNPRALVAT